MPLSAITKFLFWISVSIVLASTSTFKSPSPPKSSVTLSPAANTTLPARAITTPSFITSGAKSATKPLSCAVISP